ncbi:MAG: glycosyltransferase family 2 protein [Chloroflexi bacterium]|nr:MAG: glycosyltransferase family 2 protein [Chloroflexota bacterium]
MPSLSVIVPCYNEEGSIGPFLRELAGQAGYFSRFEVIVVDDASRDGSPSIIRSLAAELPLRVVTHPRNLGLGAAVRTGFNAATLEWVTYLPGDGQVPAGEVGKFLPYMAAYDLIITRRGARLGYTGYRRLASAVYTAWVSAAFGLRVRDFNWVQTWRRSLWLRQPSVSDSVFFCAEFLIRCRAAQPRMVEIEIGYLPRRAGRAKNGSPRAALKAAWHITRLFVQETQAGRFHFLHPVAPDRPEPLREHVA